MELEVREVSGEEKAKLGHRLKAYKNEMKRFQQDLVSNSLFQRTRLLDNTERLERTGNNLEEGYKICVETEQIGVDIMNNLQRDREVIERARDRTRQTDSTLSKSSRVLTGMMRR
ncbi:PREDICTED: vesicle transport through interaction with t-SNAREs homolog 1A-like [Acropora digitifera]|uniref:vesicle transport through interaction with t-SNAREs homolog 1A-like n=1 Tax=Acropora digitifera TaxID=70779 RepID=UPI00077ADB00|nr:PREDICTED: vesicle transport through interaction with t-SNAREs homolog 1A-like [Acropora digitifera]